MDGQGGGRGRGQFCFVRMQRFSLSAAAVAHLQLVEQGAAASQCSVLEVLPVSVMITLPGMSEGEKRGVGCSS